MARKNLMSFEKDKKDHTNKNKRWTNADLAEFVELRDAGIGITDLANYFQRTKPAIQALCVKFTHLKEIGIPVKAYAMLVWLKVSSSIVYDLTKENYVWKPYPGEESLREEGGEE